MPLSAHDMITLMALILYTLALQDEIQQSSEDLQLFEACHTCAVVSTCFY